MAFERHWRMTMLGSLGGGENDRFSYGINLAREDGGVLGSFMDPNDDVWADMRDAAVAFHGRAATGLSSQAFLDTVKIADIGPDGKYLEDPVVFTVAQGGASAPDFVDGVAVTNVLPQSAIAVSLTTDRRGPSGKGRFYLPMPAFGTFPQNGFKISVADAEGLRGSAQTFLNDVANQPGLDVLGIRPVVASTKGYNTAVTGVRVGRVIDTIRTRRNKLNEAYTASVSVG